MEETTITTKFDELTVKFEEMANPLVGKGEKKAYLAITGEQTPRGLHVSISSDGDMLTLAGAICSLIRHDEVFAALVRRTAEMNAVLTKIEDGEDEAGD